MPKEVRCIMLDERDSHIALSNFLKSRGTNIGPGEIEKLELFQTASGPGARLSFEAHCDEPSIVLESADLLGAALMFCSSRRIPLPNLGHKTLEMSGRNLIVVVMTSLADSKGAPKRVKVEADDSSRRIALGLIGVRPRV